MILTAQSPYQCTLKTKFGVVVFAPQGKVPSGTNVVLQPKIDNPTELGVPKEGEPYVIAAPGEYEVGGISVFGHYSPDGVLFVVQAEDMTVGYLGKLTSVPGSELLDEVGTLDVLLAPGVGGDVLDGKGLGTLARALEPSYLVPMGLDMSESGASSLQEFFKAYGVTVEPQNTLALAAGGMPEQTQLVVLRT